MSLIPQQFVVVLVLSSVILTAPALRISYKMGLVDFISHNNSAMLADASERNGRVLNYNFRNKLFTDLKFEHLCFDCERRLLPNSVFQEPCKFLGRNSWNTSFKSSAFSSRSIRKMFYDFILASDMNSAFEVNGTYLQLTKLTMVQRSGPDGAQLASIRRHHFNQIERHLEINKNSNRAKKSGYYGSLCSASHNSTQIDGLRRKLFTDYSQKQLHRSSQQTKLIVVICVLSLVMLVTCLAGIAYYLRKKTAVLASILSRTLGRFCSRPREFKFQDLKKATNNFGEEHKLGTGRCSVVYKGVLLQENTEVAIKLFLKENIEGKIHFLAELRLINRLQHKHLVNFLGWCHNDGVLHVVYEYMKNGSLDNYLFGCPDKILCWSSRYKVIIGVGSALQYIHKEYGHKLVHGGVKCSNIMLDSEMTARLGDFGLKSSLENGESTSVDVSSTIAPECILTGNYYTPESDIYGFGVVLLEVTCGRRSWTKKGKFRCLANWVWWLYRRGRLLEAIDVKLESNFVVDEAERLLRLGLACSCPIANVRPKAHELLQMIMGYMPAPYIPPFRPSLQSNLKESKH